MAPSSYNSIDNTKFEHVPCRDCGQRILECVSRLSKNPGRRYYGCAQHGWQKWVVADTLSNEDRSEICRGRLGRIQSRQEFQQPDKAIVMTLKLKKIRRLTNKKVQLILTDSLRFLSVDPSRMIAKTSWSYDPNELNVQAASFSSFKICTVCFFTQALFILSIVRMPQIMIVM